LEAFWLSRSLRYTLWVCFSWVTNITRHAYIYIEVSWSYCTSQVQYIVTWCIYIYNRRATYIYSKFHMLRNFTGLLYCTKKEPFHFIFQNHPQICDKSCMDNNGRVAIPLRFHVWEAGEFI
jgi:hypothetical protein